MRRLLRSTGAAIGLPLLVAFAASCTGNELTPPTFDGTLIPVNAPHGSFFLPSEVRLSEIHYDNSGTDTGERIEITAPVGQDLSGWKLVLYNGANGSAYNTRTLSGTVTASPGCPSGRGVVVVNYPTDGIQNGSPDGMALVGPDGVVEFLTYEGIFEAAGINGTDIGVSEPGTSAVTNSLQRGEEASWFWRGPLANTFGSCNAITAPQISTVVVSPGSATLVEGGRRQFTATARNAANQTVTGVMFSWSSSNPAVATVVAGLATGLAAGDVQITATAGNVASGTAALHVDEATLPDLPATLFSELHYDNAGTDANEAIEIEGPAGTDVSGWQVILYNGSGGSVYDTQVLLGTIPSSCGARGVMVVRYEQDGIQNGPDGMALVTAEGQVVEFLSWEGSFTAAEGPASGLLSRNIGVAQGSSGALGQSLQRRPSGNWDAPRPSTFGGCYGSTPNPPTNVLTFSGRSPFDVPLPVGFEDQIFGNLRSPANEALESSMTWVSLTPSVASIDADGVVRALAAGSARFRGTAQDGTTATYTLPTTIATASTSAVFGNHTEFGDPVDSDAGDDHILRRREFTSSFNRNRGIPNWVSYNLDPSHMGTQDRCDCFTYDPELPADFTRYTTADYTNAGSYHGYGIDRGHLARSADRTAGSLDNANTFYFSNIIPQAADNNQGPWMHMENHLGSLAQQGKELYVIAGASGSKGTIKDEGIITIPTHTWKVAVIMPRDRGLTDVASFEDLEIIAVIMPNEPGLRTPDTHDDDNWRQYITTVNAVETLSGYNLLALLPDEIEGLLESGLSEGVVAIRGLVAAGTLDAGNANSLTVKLSGAAASIERGQHMAAANTLRAFLNELQAMERSGRMSISDATALRAIAEKVLAIL